MEHLFHNACGEHAALWAALPFLSLGLARLRLWWRGRGR